MGKKADKLASEFVKDTAKKTTSFTSGRILAFSPLLFLGFEYYCSGSMV